MLKWRLESEARKTFKRFQEDLLNDVFHLVLTSRVTTGGGKNPGLVALDQLFEAGRFTGKHLPDEGLVGDTFLAGRGAIGHGIHGGGDRGRRGRLGVLWDAGQISSCFSNCVRFLGADRVTRITSSRRTPPTSG